MRRKASRATWLQPLQVSQGEVVRGALLVLFDQDDPLEAIARAKRRREDTPSAKEEGSA